MTIQCRTPTKLAQEQVEEAVRLIDVIGDVSNGLEKDEARILNRVRSDLKALINRIEGECIII